MKFIAVIDMLDQIGPDDWRNSIRTAVFEGGATLQAVLAWARTHNPNVKPHDIRFSETE